MDAIVAIKRKNHKISKESRQSNMGSNSALNSPTNGTASSLLLDEKSGAPSILFSTAQKDERLDALTHKLIELEDKMTMMQKNSEMLEQLLSSEQQQRMHDHRVGICG